MDDNNKRLKIEKFNYQWARVGNYVLVIIISLIIGVITFSDKLYEYNDSKVFVALITIIVVLLLMVFILAILRIRNITYKIRLINSTIMKIESCKIDDRKRELEINRLTQELNADSSRNIWRAIFNSR